VLLTIVEVRQDGAPGARTFAKTRTRAVCKCDQLSSEIETRKEHGRKTKSNRRPQPLIQQWLAADTTKGVGKNPSLARYLLLIRSHLRDGSPNDPTAHLRSPPDGRISSRTVKSGVLSLKQDHQVRRSEPEGPWDVSNWWRLCKTDSENVTKQEALRIGYQTGAVSPEDGIRRRTRRIPERMGSEPTGVNETKG
jgi:hypothetical protein